MKLVYILLKEDGRYYANFYIEDQLFDELEQEFNKEGFTLSIVASENGGFWVDCSREQAQSIFKTVRGRYKK